MTIEELKKQSLKSSMQDRSYERSVAGRNSKLSTASFGKIVNHTSRRTSRKSKIGTWLSRHKVGIRLVLGTPDTRSGSSLRYDWLLVLVSWFFVSCEPPVESMEYEEKLVVFGNLIANSPIIDTLFVSLSYEIEEPHEAEEKWVDGAKVIIFNDVGDTFIIPQIFNSPGCYLDSTYSIIIKPNMAYHLDVEWQNYHVTATTLVPDTFSIESIESTGWECGGEPIDVPAINLHENENNRFLVQMALATGNYSLLSMDTLIYREGSCYTASFASAPMFAIRWEAETEPGMIRAVSWALEDTITNAIVDTSLSANAFKGPMYKDENGNYYRPNPVVWNLSQNELHFGWLSFNYYGVHLIMIQATDHSFSEYFRGDPFRQNQYILPNSNIEGGYGLFSSLYYRYFFVYIAPDTTGGE